MNLMLYSMEYVVENLNMSAKFLLYLENGENLGNTMPLIGMKLEKTPLMLLKSTSIYLYV